MINVQVDQPIALEIEDRFQRYSFARQIASLIATPKIKSSLVVGVYGKWGSGKSTVMNFIENELPAETIKIRINPWRFSDERDLLTSFFNSVANAVGASLKKKHERIGKALAKYADAIGLVTNRVGISGDTLRTLGNKLNSASIDELKARVDDIIVEANQNLVIFIDDIDRLDVEEIQQVFKLVKLVADFPRTSYVLAFDDEMVAAALAPKYGDKTYKSGAAFLEKIVQVPMPLPMASKRQLSNFIRERIESVLVEYNITLGVNAPNDFLTIFENYFLPFTTTPRVASGQSSK